MGLFCKHVILILAILKPTALRSENVDKSVAKSYNVGKFLRSGSKKDWFVGPTNE